MTAADAARAPLTCNMQLLGQYGAKGGYKVERYVDAAGHECAYYDTTLLFPKDAATAGQQLTGVFVLDMSDPSHPKRTTTLVSPAMQSPHESMALNQARGLLGAVTGNPVFYPGQADFYDVTADCRNPVLQSTLPSGVMGHEGNWAPDGKTFYSAGWYSEHVVAIDVTNPMAPAPLWIGSYGHQHGLSISDDGNRAYMAVENGSVNPGYNGLVIVDTSQIQSRVLNPQASVVATLDWPETRSTPQATIPVTIQGHKYLIEHDEFGGGTPQIGAGRIIDIADDTHPQIVSNIKLEVNMPANQADQVNDPGSGTIFRGYGAHYCEVPQRHEPGLLACTFILSGLRLFDIRDPFNPKEVAYFSPKPHKANDGTPDSSDPASNFSMSKPVFVPERNEIWFTDGNSGFYALRLTNGVGTAPDVPEAPLALLLPLAAMGVLGIALLAAQRRRHPRGGSRKLP